MSAVRYVVLAVAAVSAVGLAVVVRGAIGSQPEAQAAAAVERPEPTVKVLVAARDLKVGERLSEADLTWQDWPAKAVNPAFFVDGEAPAGVTTIAAEADAAAKAAAEKAAKDKGDKPKKSKDEEANAADKAASAAAELLSGARAKQAFVDSIVREPVMAGEPVLDRKLVRAGESGFMAVVLKPGMRAMAVPVKVETAAGGFVLPGDRVDVIVSFEEKSQEEGGTDRMVSRTVLQNIRVLAVDQTTEPAKDAQAVVGATATLEIHSRDAESLALASARGDLSLALRSYADVDQASGGTGMRFDAPPRVSVAAAPSGPQPGTVRLFRGGEASDVQVSR